MAMNNLSTNARNALADALTAQIDVGATQAFIRIYTAAFGLLLAELDYSNPAFLGAAAGVDTADTITGEASAPAAGTAAVCRITDRNAATVWEGTVTATSGGGDIELSNLVIAVADTVDISAQTVTAPS
jgi:hypothetical protein